MIVVVVVAQRVLASLMKPLICLWFFNYFFPFLINMLTENSYSIEN